MSIQAIKSTSNIAFQGNKTKKTPRGNEYQVTNMSRTAGGTVGLLSGALLSKIALSNQLKTTAGKRELITSFNNMDKSLNFFGKAGKRGQIKTGITILASLVAAAGMFVGAAIGGTVDSHNNHNRAKAADKAAKANA